MDRFDRQAQGESKRETWAGGYAVWIREGDSFRTHGLVSTYEEAGKHLAAWRRERAAELRLKDAARIFAKAGAAKRSAKQAEASRQNGAKSKGRPKNHDNLTDKEKPK